MDQHQGRMNFYDPTEIVPESDMNGVESQILAAPISDSEEFVLETEFTCVDFSKMEEIVPETELLSVGFSASAVFLSKLEVNGVDLHMIPLSFSNSQRLPSILNWYEREEGRSEFLVNLRRFVPRLSKFVSDAESKIDNMQELSADDGAHVEYLQMLGIFFPIVLKLTCKNASEYVVPKTDLSDSQMLPSTPNSKITHFKHNIYARKLEYSIYRF
ncbi:hypothetical protein OROMI_033681 [Orobanche minor]